MFADTITITINAVDKILKKINQDNYGSEYILREATGEFRMKIRNSSSQPKTLASRLNRHNVEVSHTVFATETTPELLRRLYFVYEDQTGDDPTESIDFAVGVSAFQSEANLTKLYNWES